MSDNSGKTQARLRSILTQIASFGLAILLLYLALRNVDLGDLWIRIRSASFGWVVPLTAFVFASHVLRAWRWQILLGALKDGGRSVSLARLFGALMAGYMANYAAPRLGELVRTSIASRLSQHRFPAVLGTVVAERLLDMVSLALALLSVALLLRNQIQLLVAQMEVPAILSEGSRFLAIGLAVAALAVAFFVFSRRRNQRLDDPGRAQELITSFVDGLRTILYSGRPLAIVLSTVVMWACYLMMAYLPMRMLGLTTSFDLGLADAWSLMNIGALGVVVPSPGGTGTYHYITQLSLTNLWAVTDESAAAYAILTHAIQMVLYVLAGFVSLLMLGIGFGSLLSPPVPPAETVDE